MRKQENTSHMLNDVSMIHYKINIQFDIIVIQLNNYL